MAPLSGLPDEALPVRSMEDVALVRRAARSMALAAGFDRAASEAIVLSSVELATNLVRYAPGGDIRIRLVTGERGTGLVVESVDHGPGIGDLRLALQDGFSTGGGLGSGLPAVQRLMDEFEIESTDSGTRTVATLWLQRR